jgi:hypothetical protein
MTWRLLSRLMTLAAALGGWASLAAAHGQAPAAPWNGYVAFDGAADLAVASLLAGGLWLTWRRFGLRGATAGLRRLAAAGTVALLIWALPSISLHDTHHILERASHDVVDTTDDACPVALIAHSQAGAVLPVLAAPMQPVPAGAVLPLDLLALPSRIAPEPAARSPPV